MSLEEILPEGEALVFEGGGAVGPYTGPGMTPWQYEALCRHAISREYGVPISEIQTGYLEGGTKAKKNIRHQIDLFWTSRDSVCDFVVFANAKWRQSNVSLAELMTLIGVWRDIHAHKAMMITNTGYSASAVAQARDKGIALLVVRPAATIDFSGLTKRSAATVAGELEQIAARGVEPLYRLGIIHRTFASAKPASAASAAATVPEDCAQASVEIDDRMPLEIELEGGLSIANKMISGHTMAGAGRMGLAFAGNRLAAQRAGATNNKEMQPPRHGDTEGRSTNMVTTKIRRCEENKTED